MSATSAAKKPSTHMYGESALLAIGDAAVELVKAKLRAKGQPKLWSHGTDKPYLIGSWTNAEYALYEAVKQAGLL